MKKAQITAAVIAAALCVTGLAGCGEDKTTEKSDVKTVTMWSSNSHSKTVMGRLVDGFNNGEGKKLGIKFEYVVKEGSSLTNSIEVALQTGQAPDILAGAGGLKGLLEKGYVTALSDLPGSDDFLKKYEGKLTEGTNIIDGKVYSVPTYITTIGLIYNKDMFREAGIVDKNGEPTPPETFEEMREYAKRLTNKSKNKFGVIFPARWSGWVGHDIQPALQGSFGHFGFNPVTGEYDYSGLAPIINAYMGMIDDGSVFPGMEGMDNDPARAYFAQGMVGMKIGMSFDAGVLNEQFPAVCDWGVAPLPVVDKNNKYLQYCKYAGTPPVNSKSAAEKGEACLKFIEWFVSDEVFRELYANGMEMPVDWDIVKDVEMKKDIKGWSEFAELAKISAERNRTPSNDMSGMLSLSERVMNDVLSGKVSAEEMLKQYNRDITAATKKYYDMHPNESIEEYMNKDWNIKR